jgi:signal transduction protein with GAF and PtsI domain
MAEKKVQSYEDKSYKQKKNLYDSIVQAWANLKAEKSAEQKFIASEKLKGVTFKLLNGTLLSLTYHRVETGTLDTIARDAEECKSFLKDIEKELKKSFKKLTKKTLKLKKVKEDQIIDKYSHLQADTSWMVGSSRYGYGGQAGKYVVRDTVIFSFDEDTLE